MREIHSIGMTVTALPTAWIGQSRRLMQPSAKKPGDSIQEKANRFDAKSSNCGKAQVRPPQVTSCAVFLLALLEKLSRRNPRCHQSTASTPTCPHSNPRKNRQEHHRPRQYQCPHCRRSRPNCLGLQPNL